MASPASQSQKMARLGLEPQVAHFQGQPSLKTLEDGSFTSSYPHPPGELDLGAGVPFRPLLLFTCLGWVASGYLAGSWHTCPLSESVSSCKVGLVVIKASLQRAVRIEGVTSTKARQAEPGIHGRRPDGWVPSVVGTSCGKHAGLECLCSLPSCEGLAQVDLWSEATWEPTVRLCLRCCPQLLPRGGQCVCQGVLAAGSCRPGFRLC